MSSSPSSVIDVRSMITSEVVRAGAGAGKTYTLTHQVLDFAEEYYRTQKKFPRVVVTTFTRKATQELRERLMRLALKERPHVIEWVASRSHLQVSTIHGITEKFLRRYGRKVDLDASPSFASEEQSLKMRKRSLRTAFLQNPEFLPMLAKQSFDEVLRLTKAIDEKTRLEPDYQPVSQAMIRTLAEKQVDELRRELARVLAEIELSVTDEKWLAVAAALKLRLHEWNLAIVETDVDRLIEMREALGGLRKSKNVDASVSDSKKDWVELAEKVLTSSGMSIGSWELEAQENVQLWNLVVKYREQFEAMKKQAGLIELNDLEILAAQLIRVSPESASSFANEWDYWLIDEFQDTSPVQVEILRSLVGQSPCFVVGDPQQSIYLFRGARSEVFLEKEQEIQENGGQLKALNKNYRSHPELLEFFNDLFAKLPGRFRAMEPISQKFDSKRIVARTLNAVDEVVERDAIVARISHWLHEGVSPSEICILARKKSTLHELASALNARGIPSYIAISSGFHERREIQDALALLKFLVNPHDNLNLLELLRTPWFRVADQKLAELQRSKASFWNQFLDLRREFQRRNPRLDPSVHGEEFEVITHLEQALSLKVTHGFAFVFQDYLHKAGLLEFSHHSDSSGRREANLWKLVSQLAQAERQPGFSPQGFVRESASSFSLDDSGGEGDAVAAVEPNRVNLMTIHGSKGLQFRHVIVPGLNERPKATSWSSVSFAEDLRVWTHRFADEDGDSASSLLERHCVRQMSHREREENLRVFYVALTRAVESVFLTWSGLKSNPNKGSWLESIQFPFSEGTQQFEKFQVLGLSGPEEFVSWDQKTLVHESVPLPWLETQSVTSRMESQKGRARAPRLSVSRVLALQELQRVGTSLSMRNESRGSQDKKASRDMGLVSPQEGVLRAQRGTGMHRIFELLKYPSRDRIEALVRQWFPNEVEAVLQAIQFTLGLQTPPIVEILKNGFPEWSFVVREKMSGLAEVSAGEIELEGQVDLWGVADGTCWIIDYKTGSMKNSDKAFAQMRLYALAIRKSPLFREMNQSQALSMKLVALYPFEQKVFVEAFPATSSGN